jgi:hypothetical protein
MDISDYFNNDNEQDDQNEKPNNLPELDDAAIIDLKESLVAMSNEDFIAHGDLVYVGTLICQLKGDQVGFEYGNKLLGVFCDEKDRRQAEGILPSDES